MHLQVVAKYLGIVLLILGGSMCLSLPWAFPQAGVTEELEVAGLRGLGAAILFSVVGGGALLAYGRRATASLLRKEALAIVGLSWIAATILGAIPIVVSGARGTPTEHRTWSEQVVDALFESGSGFTGTGATVLANLEDPALLPRCILFWRQQTHFLGGLGIMVLFVAILGHGVPGRMLMKAEMAGPSKNIPHTRMQHTAWAFAAIYLGLNALLTALYLVQGMSLYDGLSHSFATVATGGFSTYNASLAHFEDPVIEMITVVFMVLACTNFMLLFWLARGHFRPLLTDVEWRTYMAILTVATLLIATYGMRQNDFSTLGEAFRLSVFQVVSIQTNTGLATADFDTWSIFSQALLLILMFIGGCAGSTSCAIKVIRYCLIVKVLGYELERAYHPNVVRKIRLGGEPIDIQAVERTIPLYFAVFGILCLAGWLGLMATESDALWNDAGRSVSEKSLDCASAVAATINGVGPGLGVVGPTQNFGLLSSPGKLILLALMLLGRLELYVILVLFVPAFWHR